MKTLIGILGLSLFSYGVNSICDYVELKQGLTTFGSSTYDISNKTLDLDICNEGLYFQCVDGALNAIMFSDSDISCNGAFSFETNETILSEKLESWCCSNTPVPANNNNDDDCDLEYVVFKQDYETSANGNIVANTEVNLNVCNQGLIFTCFNGLLYKQIFETIECDMSTFLEVEDNQVILTEMVDFCCPEAISTDDPDCGYVIFENGLTTSANGYLPSITKFNLNECIQGVIFECVHNELYLHGFLDIECDTNFYSNTETNQTEIQSIGMTDLCCSYCDYVTPKQDSVTVAGGNVFGGTELSLDECHEGVKYQCNDDGLLLASEYLDSSCIGDILNNITDQIFLEEFADFCCSTYLSFSYETDVIYTTDVDINDIDCDYVTTKEVIEAYGGSIAAHTTVPVNDCVGGFSPICNDDGVMIFYQYYDGAGSCIGQYEIFDNQEAIQQYFDVCCPTSAPTTSVPTASVPTTSVPTTSVPTSPPITTATTDTPTKSSSSFKIKHYAVFISFIWILKLFTF